MYTRACSRQPGVSSTSTSSSCHTYMQLRLRLHINHNPNLRIRPALVPTVLPRSSPYDRQPLRSLCSVSRSASAQKVPIVPAKSFSTSRGRNLLRYTPTYRYSTPISTSTSTFLSPSSFISQRRLFSNTPIAMTATKIDGTAIAKSIRERLHKEILATQKVNPRYKPSLKIIQGNFCTKSEPQFHANFISTVGERSDSSE